MEKQKDRLNYLDIAKGIAMIAIIIGHLGIGLVNRIVFTFHIPLFLLVTGCFTSDKYTLVEFRKKRFRSLMLLYAVTCLVIIIIGTIRGLWDNGPVEAFLHWLYASVYGAGNTFEKPFYIPQIGAIWFLPATFIGQLLLRWSLDQKKEIRIIVLASAFIAGAVTAKYLFWFPMSIQAGLCCASFMYVGWLFGRNRDAVKKLTEETKIAFIALSVVIWIWFIVQFKGFYIVRCFFGRGIVDIIGSICASGVIILCSRVIDRKLKVIKKLLLFVGRYSLLILCVHIIELDLFPWQMLMVDCLHIPEMVYKYSMLIIKPAVVLCATWILLKFAFVRRLFGYEVKA